MKKIISMFISFTVLMIAALLVFLNFEKNSEYDKRDILYYNDCLFRIEEELENGMNESETEEKYECSIILDKEINNPELAELYASGALVLDLVVDDEYIGKVAWNDFEKKYLNTGYTFLKASLAMWGVVLLAGYALMAYLFFSFIKPIEELENFATDIAKGELDKKLPIHKNNMFGSFVEGFDLMREQLKASFVRERKAEIARKELIQGLSHDIKTPLSVIKATCEVLELKLKRKEAGMSDAEREENDELIGKIASISDKADTISSLMSDVMHANLEELETVEVNPVEEDSTIVEDFLRNLSDYGNIILENDIHSCLVYMDKIRMEQVIDNVIGNSYKYAKTDIRVRFFMTEEMPLADGGSTSFVKITISDSGPGVSADDLPLLAEKYYRGKNALNENGYGLGMYLCRLYMEKQGGGMDFYNDNGFTVELLLRKV